MVHNVPSPRYSTKPAMIASTSDSSDPARINLRMLRTDSLEKKPDSFCARSTFGRSCVDDCVADVITGTSGLERRLGHAETATPPGRQNAIMAEMFRLRPDQIVGLADSFLPNPGDGQATPGNDLFLGYTMDE
jgi:hypothetical protein